jgi:hypothetical protein
MTTFFTFTLRDKTLGNRRNGKIRWNSRFGL